MQKRYYVVGLEDNRPITCASEFVPASWDTEQQPILFDTWEEAEEARIEAQESAAPYLHWVLLADDQVDVDWLSEKCGLL